MYQIKATKQWNKYIHMHWVLHPRIYHKNIFPITLGYYFHKKVIKNDKKSIKPFFSVNDYVWLMQPRFIKRHNIVLSHLQFKKDLIDKFKTITDIN